ncbi:MAG: glucose-6-phosphate dehydrogenase assembly protein OpcA [Deltaproteobacteria bacterium]|nr:glucose-6-phosphate dehydrogenase assembly protein OpcA [Deltaproteobacteria bacterium]
MKPKKAEGAKPAPWLTFGAGAPVNLSRVEEELDAQWRKAAKENSQGVSRACLWNMVVYDDDDIPQTAETNLLGLRDDPLSLLLDQVTPTVPCRVIRLEALPGRTEPDQREVEAWVASKWRQMGEGGQIFSEEISINAYGEAGHAHFPAMVRALLVADIPVSLLWLGSLPKKGRLLKQLIEMSDRVVIDTQTAKQGHHLVEANDLEQFTHASMVDLGWLRLTPLRYLLAGLFDKPARADCLKNVQTISIAATAQNRNSGYLFLGWLLDRLGVVSVKGVDSMGGGAAESRWKAKTPQTTLDARFTISDGEGGADGLAWVEIKAEDQVFTLRQVDGLHVELQGPEHPLKKVALLGWNDPELVAAALGGHGMDPLYPAVLALAAKLVQEETWNS